MNKEAFWRGFYKEAAKHEKDVYTENVPAGTVFHKEFGKYRRSELYDKKNKLLSSELDEEIGLPERVKNHLLNLKNFPGRYKDELEETKSHSSAFRNAVSSTKEMASILGEEKYKPLHHVYRQDMV